jgi:toxin-antitoxin system PIN domain toxin
MILIDANLLLYASDTASVHHHAARRWLETTLSEPEPVGLAWVVLLAFLRVGTNSRLRRDALSLPEAAAIVAGWLERPMVVLLNPGERHWEILRDLMTKGQAYGSLIMDAHLAALAIEHGATLATTDRDFTRFPGLRILDPLASAS